MAIQPKIGDVVHVRGTVVKTLDGEVGLDVGNIMGGVPHYFWIPSSCVVHVERAPLKVGDCVSWVSLPMEENTGQVLAIDSNVAWVKLPNGSRIDRYLSVLERADEPRPLKVGDKVRHKSGWFGTIVELPDVMPDGARVRRGNLTINDVPKSYLERVE